jgi:hypothetical protein
MKEIRIGRGCGKSGMKDNPKTMPKNVNANVKTLRRLVSSERSLASFSLNFFHLSLIQAGPRGIAAFVGNFNRDNLKPYFIKSFLKLVMGTPVETAEASFDVIESIRQHIAQIKPLAPKRSLICIGDYPTKLFKETFAKKIGGAQPIFIQKSSKESPSADPHDIVAIDPDVDTHFWFDIAAYLAKNDGYSTRLRNKIEGLQENIIFASLWEGLGSALLPFLISQFNATNANSVALAMLPSKVQPSDAHFNAFASIGMCASNDTAAVVLLDRDRIEDYVGVDRDGSRMNGNVIIDYLLGMMLAKETFTQEFSELSRSFNVKLYTILTVTGASLKIYGSFKNMLNAASLNPFLMFDLSTASVLYVLVRVPLHLKEKFTRGKIELATAKWSRKMANIKSIYVSEPIYVDDNSDRVDAVMFAGCFDLTELTAFFQKKSDEVKSETVKNGLVKEEEWTAIVKSLTTNK